MYSRWRIRCAAGKGTNIKTPISVRDRVDFLLLMLVKKSTALPYKLLHYARIFMHMLSRFYMLQSVKMYDGELDTAKADISSFIAWGFAIQLP